MIRRAYLTYDKKINAAFAAKLQLELNQTDFATTTSTMIPFLKQAHLAYNRGLQTVYFGLAGTPTWDVVESHWGYRFVEKTPLDLQKLGSSVDGGLAFKGHFDAEKKWGYHFMAGNGAGTGSETNDSKKFYLSLTAAPAKKVLFQVYGDFEDNKSGTPGSDAYTLQVFAGLKGDAGRGGLLFAQRATEKNGIDTTLDIFSLYGVANLKEDLSLFARVDRMSDPNPNAHKIAYLPMANDKSSTLAILGLDYKIDQGIRIAPNLEAVFYSNDANIDLIPRVTFYYIF